MSGIKTRLEILQKEIPKEVQLMAVSKGQPSEKIKEATECGLSLFGENYVQEFLEKWEATQMNPVPAEAEIKPEDDIQWHFIGHLQTNKVKYIIDKVSSIDSVDSLKLFQTIHKEAQKIQKKISILIEINVGGEKTKSGISPKDVHSLLQALPKSPWVELQGLMAIPPFHEDPEKSRPYFKKMRTLQKELQRQFPQFSLTELSMGMTHDFKIAIEEGATQVRIGEGIFGKRQKWALRV
ncbi:MAG: YggS family pyridoxal phosphate-dependent enzyme [Deltaproteobacteria bacterium]|nr:YggS family pyridoxal phosphate-dependent enzyme [Deltaproteobacteria bacterium]MBI3017275.1 YggS family pyridoxal phosphate-dependent enzyme [Deltaproteobacteria bacterium]